MSSLEELFCHIDDFCQEFEPQWLATDVQPWLKNPKTIHPTVLERNHDNYGRLPERNFYRTFKHFYLEQVCRH